MTDSNKFGLPAGTIQKLKTTFESEPQIHKVIIYGSRAKGNYRKGSDIDLTIMAPDFNLTDLNRIDNKIDDLLLPYMVDLSLYHYIQNPDLIDHIKRIGIEFYKKENT